MARGRDEARALMRKEFEEREATLTKLLVACENVARNYPTGHLFEEKLPPLLPVRRLVVAGFWATVVIATVLISVYLPLCMLASLPWFGVPEPLVDAGFWLWLPASLALVILLLSKSGLIVQPSQRAERLTQRLIQLDMLRRLRSKLIVSDSMRINTLALVPAAMAPTYQSLTRLGWATAWIWTVSASWEVFILAHRWNYYESLPKGQRAWGINRDVVGMAITPLLLSLTLYFFVERLSNETKEIQALLELTLKD